jgi:DNA polymerase-3 subunit gamma/tau
MSYHTDYRPKTFDDFLGNDSLVKSLKSLLSKEKHPHTYMFHGESGCGKTTLARIIANYLKCNESDVFEVNMSNNRGIDTARSIIERCELSPMFGNTMVIILDEVHKSTNEFQNAMLKVLEDTPKNIYFILCTTDPHKVLLTVRNRCTQFEVSKLTASNLEKLLNVVIKNEKLKIEKDIINKIVNKSEGCSREALILLEKVKDLSIDELDKSIDNFSIEKEEIISLCRRLINKSSSWKMIAASLSKIQDEPETVRRAVLGYCSAVLLKEENARAFLILDYFKDHFYDSGKAGLIHACYGVVCGG